MESLEVHPQQRHIPSLDGLRGFAALAVMAYHILGAGDSRWWPIVLLQRVIGFGWAGVDLFFVLSGFLITGILCEALNAKGGLSTFYIRRVLRIFPLYYLVIGVAVALPHLLRVRWAGVQWVYLVDWQNNLSLMRPRDYNLHTITHFWTLALEEQFYLVWPVVLFSVRSKRKLLFASLCLCALALGIRIAFYLHGSAMPVLVCTTLCRFDALLLGGCISLAQRNGWHRVLDAASFRVFLGAAVLLGLIVVHLHGLPNENPLTATIGFTLIDLLFGSLLLMALRRETLASRIFSVRWLRWVGTYSYGLYVYHEIISILIVPIRQHIDVHHSKLLGVLGAGFAVISLSFAVAILSYTFFELPILRLKKHFIYNEGTTKVAQPSLGT